MYLLLLLLLLLLCVCVCVCMMHGAIFLKELGCRDVERNSVAGSYEHRNEHSGSIQRGEFLYDLS
jgi:hypothetical protein